jgi:hypothetical protein
MIRNSEELMRDQHIAEENILLFRKHIAFKIKSERFAHNLFHNPERGLGLTISRRTSTTR